MNVSTVSITLPTRNSAELILQIEKLKSLSFHISPPSIESAHCVPTE